MEPVNLSIYGVHFTPVQPETLAFLAVVQNNVGVVDEVHFHHLFVLAYRALDI